MKRIVLSAAIILGVTVFTSTAEAKHKDLAVRAVVAGAVVAKKQVVKTPARVYRLFRFVV